MNVFRKVYYPVIALVTALILFQACGGNKDGAEAIAAIPDSVSYNFDIRPILSDKCLACHGPDANKRKAGLRMDDPQSAFAALKENPGAHALVAGNPNCRRHFFA